MEEIQGADVIESKAITLLDPKHGSRIPMILTAFEEQDNEVLDSAGYRGRDVMVALIDGGVHEAHTDPYKFEHHIVEGQVQGFISDIIRGWKTYGKEGINWADLEHGGVYEQGELQQLD